MRIVNITVVLIAENKEDTEKINKFESCYSGVGIEKVTEESDMLILKSDQSRLYSNARLFHFLENL